MKLMEKGRKVLGIDQAESDRHGGPEHRYWIERIAEHLRDKGYEVTTEVPVGNGKTIDVVATRQGRRIAFEIETGKSDTIANVEKCLDAGFDRIVVVATSARVRSKLSNTLPNHKRVELRTVSEFLVHSDSN